MFILMEHLGSDYVVWDKSAEIEFIKRQDSVVDLAPVGFDFLEPSGEETALLHQTKQKVVKKESVFFNRFSRFT
mgnify:CR=1 FL=1